MSNTKKALRYFAKYLKPYWKGITIVVILSLISSGAQVMAPTYLGRSVTALTTYLVDLKKCNIHEHVLQRVMVDVLVLLIEPDSDFYCLDGNVQVQCGFN